MQIEAFGAFDRIILAPAVRREIAAAAKRAMQNAEERRAFERETVFAGICETFDVAAAGGFRPSPLEHQRRADAARGVCRERSLGCGAVTTMAFSAKRAPARGGRSSCPLSRSSSMRPLVWRRPADGFCHPRVGFPRSADIGGRRRFSCERTWRLGLQRLSRRSTAIRELSIYFNGK